MLPVGATPPLRVAVSLIVPPTGTDGDALVTSATGAGTTVNRSASRRSRRRGDGGAYNASPL